MAYARLFDPNVWSGQIDAMENVGTGGGQMYYSGGFLPAGAGQMPSMQAPSLIGTIATGLQTFLPTLFQSRPSGGFGGVPQPVPPTQTIPATHPVIGAAGNSGSPTGAQMGGGGVRHARYGSPGQKGYHMIKRGPHAGAWTRNRHRNVCNIRALRRALSRAHGFERVARKVMHFVHPGRHGKLAFKRRARRR